VAGFEVSTEAMHMKMLPMVRVTHVETEQRQRLDAAKPLRDFKPSIGDVTPELTDRYEKHLRAM